MTERLSDEHLQHLFENPRCASPMDVGQMCDELLALRAAGPVMPETPSDEVNAAMIEQFGYGHDETSEIWHAIRAALLEHGQ